MQFVFGILKDTVLFWCRNFSALALLTLVTITPDKLLFWVMLESPQHFGLIGVLTLSAADIVLKSMQQSALLGLLLLPAKASSALQAMREGIAAGWLKFVVINAIVDLLTGTAAGAFLVAVLKHSAGVASIKLIVMGMMLMTILGYARFGFVLPVIVAERSPIWSALARAWRMTAGEIFWVVLICYFVVKTFSGAVGHLTQMHPTLHQLPSIWQRVALESLQALVDCLYLIMLGVLYQKRALHEKVLAAFDRVEFRTM